MTFIILFLVDGKGEYLKVLLHLYFLTEGGQLTRVLTRYADVFDKGVHLIIDGFLRQKNVFFQN